MSAGHLKNIQQILDGSAHVIESSFPENFPPVLFDFGDSVAGVVQCLAAADGGKDQLGAAVDGIRPALEVAQPLEIGDEFRGRGQTQQRSGGQLREPHAVDAHVAEYLQMGFAQVGVPVLGGRGEQFGAEFPEQSAQQLPDRRAVRGQVS